jgi:alanyl-tRNA synthetase
MRRSAHLCSAPFLPGKGVGPQELGKIEAIVRQQILDALPVYARDASLAEARKIVGLRAVFGEVRESARQLATATTSCVPVIVRLSVTIRACCDLCCT